MNFTKKKSEKRDLLFTLSAEIELIKERLRTDVTGPVVASFGFIIALVWRDAIQSAINEFLFKAGLLEKAYFYQFVSAIIVTIFVIAIMIFVTRFGNKKRTKSLEHKFKQKIEKVDFKFN